LKIEKKERERPERERPERERPERERPEREIYAIGGWRKKASRCPWPSTKVKSMTCISSSAISFFIE
jgi:hypothetical protein